jgi:hypothetical protein
MSFYLDAKRRRIRGIYAYLTKEVVVLYAWYIIINIKPGFSSTRKIPCNDPGIPR